ncbi:MAG: pyridoxal-phosphate dependent enzyme [Chlorobi bacterium]|nr:pyridoxal-phosphate dependent enzyme [Chlorobiota bacterium]
MDIPAFEDIRKAHLRIRDYIQITSVVTSEGINHITGSNLFFKCENFQKAGAFKYRGATNAIRTLSNGEARRGVATHSSGNHAGALAKAAAIHGIRAYIVMPETSPLVKQAAVKGYGAEITFCKSTLEAREQTLGEVIRRTGATFIHPYDNEKVICGQGTAVLEFLDQMPAPDVMITPVGGGGLLSGTSVTLRKLSPGTKIIGAEPELADDARRSFISGVIQPALPPRTIADGLLTSLSDLTFSIIRKNVDDILTTSETYIIRAMRLLWERAKIVAEPSAAVPLAVILQHPGYFKGKTTGIILSGGNVDLENLPFGQEK